MVNLEGMDLGGYTVVRQIHGGQGSGQGSGQADDVYQIRQATSGAQTTARIVHATLAPTDPLASADAAAAFATLAAAVARLEHPHIVPIYDFGECAFGADGRIRYVVMPDMPAGSLADHLAPGSEHSATLPLAIAAAIAGQAAAALQFAHDTGLVHSSLNLHTLLLRQSLPVDQPDTVVHLRLADFGLSRFLPGSSLAEPRSPVPDCLAPEQRAGVTLPASDQYALACVLYLLLVGQPPSAAGFSPASALPSRLNPALPPAVDAVLATALAANPAERYPRVVDLATALWTALRPAAYAQRAPAVASVPEPANRLAARPLIGPRRQLDHPYLPEARLSRRQVLVGMGQAASVAVLGAACASALALEHKFVPAGAAPGTAPVPTTQKPVYSRGDSVGFFRPSASTFILLSSPATPGDVTFIALGGPGDLPVAGDWNGTGTATAGVFRPSQGLFLLASVNRPNPPLAYDIAFGAPGDVPIAGDWTGAGHDGIGIFRPSAGLFLLKNTIDSSGVPDFVINFGEQGDIPLAGDWNGDGKAGIGVYRPGDGYFYLTDMLCNQCAEASTYQVSLGTVRGIPFVGDWQRSGRDGLAIFQAEQGTVYLKNDGIHTGPPDLRFPYPNALDIPIAGHWGAFPAS